MIGHLWFSNLWTEFLGNRLKFVFSPIIILDGWLGSKNRLTNQPSYNFCSCLGNGLKVNSNRERYNFHISHLKIFLKNVAAIHWSQNVLQPWRFFASLDLDFRGLWSGTDNGQRLSHLNCSPAQCSCVSQMRCFGLILSSKPMDNHRRTLLLLLIVIWGHNYWTTGPLAQKL